MKCLDCLQAELQTEIRDVPYGYKDQTTVIRNMHVHHCLACGAEYVAPGYVSQWMAQMALFRASVDARNSAPHVPDRGELKNTIIVEWLDFDPDQLAADVPVETFSRERRQRDGTIERVEHPYVSLQALRAYNERVCQAFGWYKGDHATDVPDHVYLSDWRSFLDDLRKARTIASDPYWEAPANGVVYPPNERN